MTYEEYMKSESWRTKRQERLVIDDNRCRMCGADDRGLEVHHRPDSYRLIPNESVLDHLTTLCPECHEAITNIIRNRRYAARVVVAPMIEPRIVTNVPAVENDMDEFIATCGPQWATSKPAQLHRERDEKADIEAREDRRRLYSISPTRVHGVALHGRGRPSDAS